MSTTTNTPSPSRSSSNREPESPPLAWGSYSPPAHDDQGRPLLPSGEPATLENTPSETVLRARATAHLVGSTVSEEAWKGLGRLQELAERITPTTPRRERDGLWHALQCELAPIGAALDCRETRTHADELLDRIQGVRGMGASVKTLRRRRAKRRAARVVRVADHRVEVPARYILDESGVTLLSDQGLSQRIAHRPILVVGRAVDVRSAVHWCKVWWLDHTGAEQTRWIRRGDLLTRRGVTGLASYGAPVTESQAGPLVDWLDVLDANPELPFERITTQLGWVSDACSAIAIGCRIIGDAGITLRAPPGTEARVRGFTTHGSAEAWSAAVAPVLQNFPVVAVMFGAALASLLLEPLKRSCFAVDLSGQTSRGKTTALRLAASVYGSPGDGAGVLSSWDATTVGYERQAALCGHLPLLLDETKRAEETAVKRFIYAHGTGQGRARGDVDGMRATPTWRNVLLSTGEAPITSFTEDAGTRARVLSITEAPFGDESQAECVHALTEALDRHHGWAAVMWAEHLTSADLKAIQERVAGVERAWNKVLPAGGVCARLAKHAALILVALRMAEDCGLPSGCAARVAKLLWAAVLCGADDADRPREALRALLSDLHADQCSVYWTDLPLTESGSDRPPPAGWRARIDARYTYVVSVRCRSWLKRHHYDVSGVIAAWQERGLTPSARSVKVGPGKPRCFRFDNARVDVLLNELLAGVDVECPGRRLYRSVEHADESSSGVCVDGIPVLVKLDDVEAVQVLGLDVVPQ